MPGYHRGHQAKVAQVTPPAVRELLSHAVDYAGLFPPAALDMESAVAQYAEYRRSPEAWMLGRFVVPVARFVEFGAARGRTDAGPDASPWPVTLIFGSHVERGMGVWVDPPGLRLVKIEAIETKMADPREVEDARRSAPDVQLVVEIPIATDPSPLIVAIQRAGAIAKARTGGVTPDAFPRAADVVRFVRECVARNVPFKMTAGLHHPVTGTYALTYAEDAPNGTMFGYLNVFIASGFLLAGMSDDDAVRILEERNARAFVFEADAVSWRDHRLGLGEMHRLRALMSGFGSCSFREPVEELSGIFA